MSKTNKFNPTANSLPLAARETSVRLLNQAIADLADLHSQTKQAHWNVRGPKFMMLHELFDKLAAVVEAPIDDVAERVTALGGTAHGTVRQAASGSSLPEFPEGLANDDAFTKALTQRYALAANAIRVAIDLTAAAGDADTADLFTGISRELDKALWFLEASA